MNPRPLVFTVALAVSAAFFASAPRAAFADASGDKAAAEALFDEGKRLVETGHFLEACPKLEASLARDPGIGTMLFLADCYEKTKRLASAWAQFREAEDLARKESDRRTEIAHKRAEHLEPLLARLTIRVGANVQVPGLAVIRDGRDVPLAERGAPIPVDAGEHRVEARAPGFKPWAAKVAIKDGESAALDLVPLEEEPKAVKPAPKMVEVIDDPNQGKTQRYVGIGVAAAGVVALGVGTFFSLSAKSSYDDSNAGHCRDDFCDSDGFSLRDDAFSKARVATAMFVVGGAALAAGAALYVFAPKPKLILVPAATEGGAGMSAITRF